MMTSKMLRPVKPGGGNVVIRKVESGLESVRKSYHASLGAALDRKLFVVAGFVGTLIMGGLMLRAAPSELLPQEDRGSLFFQYLAPEGTGFSATVREALKVEDANTLIESQLWQQLMHNIEHQLRKIAYAQTKDTDR